MNKIIDKTRNFIFAKQTSIVSSAMILAVMIIVSRLFGFLRYRILSGYFTKEELDIFLASFRIPDLVFEILITGTLTSSFIPIFIKYQKERKQLDESVSSIINLIFLLMLGFVSVLFLTLDWLIPLITPGFEREKIVTIIYFSRILLIGQLPFLIIGNFLTGIGQANKTFLLSSVAPILYNLAIILSAVILTPSMFLLAPIVGVVAGSILFFLIQLPLLKHSNFRYSMIIKKTEGLVEFTKIVIPRAFTVVVAQIDATIDLILTTLLRAGSYTVFYFAQHLQLLPVSVLGMAYGQASLPYLSEVYHEKRIEEFQKIITDSILNLFFFTIPIASFFIFARTPLVRLFFGGEKFDWTATVETAVTLSFFSLSLPFHAVYYFLTRCFYAFLDTRTPFLISVFSILLNTTISIIFVLLLHFPVWSLAFAFSLSITLNVIILFLFLARKFPKMDFKFLTVESAKMVLVTFISSVTTYYLMKLLDGLVFNTSFTVNVFLLLITGSIFFLGLYLFLSWFLDVKEMYLVTKIFLKMKEYQRKFVEFYSAYE